MSVSRHPTEGLWNVDVHEDHPAIVTTDQGRQLAAELFAAMYLSDVSEALPLGERMSIVLDAVADMLGRVDVDDETEHEAAQKAMGLPDDAGWISGSMGTDDVPPDAPAKDDDGDDLMEVWREHVEGRDRTCTHCGATVAIIGGRFVAHKRPQGDHCRDSGRPAQP